MSNLTLVRPRWNPRDFDPNQGELRGTSAAFLLFPIPPARRPRHEWQLSIITAIPIKHFRKEIRTRLVAPTENKS